MPSFRRSESASERRTHCCTLARLLLLLPAIHLEKETERQRDGKNTFTHTLTHSCIYTLYMYICMIVYGLVHAGKDVAVVASN
mmetsp:Transcript_50764/g.74414  ORF Transcript_50764/g.74414 Transcript_50764/m.74414 type:complete len:83 (-) Transcript_50764:2-250(-)